MPTPTRMVRVSGVHSLKVCYTQTSFATDIPSLNCPSLIEDFEISYVRTNIDDRPMEEPPRLPTLELWAPPDRFDQEEDEGSDEDTDISEDAEMDDERGPDEHASSLRIKIKLSGTDRLADLAFQAASLIERQHPTVSEETHWNDHEDPSKKWYFDGKAYSRVINGKEQYYCQLCEDEGNIHCCLKRREMERHLRRLDHLPPELFCKSAQAACPCSKNRAFTRIDGRKRHIKISIEHAKKAAQANRDHEEVERLNRHMRLLETSRGR
ncbi:hypothetical protein CPB83DRAFT_633021 [Crepidotus variabilis]|uniref:Uncharacterized protein n=1 Tax=Crepidotus variabilis TaxID=179855 RepID=A0A9P6JUN3_9AGAR|nr:hypothetical protein CPB83DRAFT_633021 [Crepidotus variabilis]